ncbi:5-methylcytosine restriction system specificity protein McrC [Rhizobium ruizarguesonis]|uniref:5-methylcytosine restriction system specificity protein McrC n=1 Tax=Rhizobium ruizarguesonis TaxID=2081791 RepID=UPI0013EEDFB9|nr:hypothetical protein [Rhizobium ruizarguesonis]
MHQQDNLTRSIVVPERGFALLANSDWALLSQNAAFWELCRSKIISVDLTKQRRYKLAGSCYTGEATLGSIRLILAEKFPGATNALLNALDPGKRKIVEAAGQGNHDYAPLSALVFQFIPSVRTYLSGFRKVRYTDELLTGIVASGRLDIRGTIKLRISGKGHKLAFRRSQITSDLPYNVCIYAALRQVERFAAMAAIPSSQIAMARALRAPLADCEKSMSRLTSDQLKKLAREQLRDHASSRPELAVPIGLASSLLEATPDEIHENDGIAVKKSWFVNLENLFEASLRNCIRRQLHDNFRVTSPQKRPDLFKPDLGRYRANPDVVIKDEFGACVMIADAKYKDIGGWPDASDVHELLAHAAGYRSPRAVIFYPSDAEFRLTTFGTSVTDCKVLAIGVRFSHFEHDVKHGLALAGVLADSALHDA